MKKSILSLFMIACLFTSCVPGGGGRRQSRGASEQTAGPDNPGTIIDPGTIVDPGTGDSGAAPDQDFLGQAQIVDGPPMSLISFLVDPETGGFTKKITIPKNFDGVLYLRVINPQPLIDERLTVRFRFGTGENIVDFDDVAVTTASGVLNAENIQFVRLNFAGRDFENVKLLFDLYDYTDYNQGDEPVTDSLDGGLYCRGLSIEHDSTFNNLDGDTVCDEPGEKCLYAYANVNDSGLAYRTPVTVGEVTTNVMIRPPPTQVQINLGQGISDYQSPSDPGSRANNALKCLPDNGRVRRQGMGIGSYLNYALTGNFGVPLINELTSSLDVSTDPNSVIHTSAGRNFYFLGPYAPYDVDNWQISPNAAVWDHVQNETEPVGLFMRELGCGTVDCGAVSLKFPRSGRRERSPAGTEYLGSALPFGTLTPTVPFDSVSIDRGFQQLTSNGDTLFMDGCNLRVPSKNPISGEGMHNCNVTASIQLVVKDREGTAVRLINTVSDVKVQLVTPRRLDANGENVLQEGFNTCSSTSECKSDECCYNGRCWDTSLVGECSEEASSNGNLAVGATCSSDFECSSLCCNSGRCSSHSNNNGGSSSCGKPQGASCVASAWCAPEQVRDCRIIRTGTDDNGNIRCALFCFNRMENGECVNNTCRAPVSIPPPAFNPNDCSQAQDAPDFMDLDSL